MGESRVPHVRITVPLRRLARDVYGLDVDECIVGDWADLVPQLDDDDGRPVCVGFAVYAFRPVPRGAMLLECIDRQGRPLTLPFHYVWGAVQAVPFNDLERTFCKFIGTASEAPTY